MGRPKETHRRIGALMVLALAGGVSVALAESPEPNVKIAQAWWPPLRHVWTPVGWKDHLFRFNVLYNGTVEAWPCIRKSREATVPYRDAGMRLAVRLSLDNQLPEDPTEPFQLGDDWDGGVGRQGWTDHATPVLWTEWPFSKAGLVIREEVFGYVPGVAASQTGIEPLYAWVRFRVTHVDELQAAERVFVLARLQNPRVYVDSNQDRNLVVKPQHIPYRQELTARVSTDAHRCTVFEPDGKVCLVGQSDELGLFRFVDSGEQKYHVEISLPGRLGASVDLLLPMLPGAEADVLSVLDAGRDDALAASDAFWSDVPDSVARVDTPEPTLNEAIDWGVKLAEVISETNPDTGDVTFLTGTMRYDALWPTPTAMVSHMLLDPLGYHEVVEKHIALFRKYQGTIKPPGASLELHPGYFSSPRTLTSIDWLADHGAILHLVARHALMTDDPAFADAWREPVLKACEFIRYARRLKGHGGMEGVLPPAVATDREVPNQSVWSDGWNYKGLTTAVRWLKRIGHPRTDEFAAEAADYRAAFRRAFQECLKEMPTWTDRQERKRLLCPHSLSGGGDVFHGFYLDTGPMFLAWAGLYDADEREMRDACDFFREGPNTLVYDPRRGDWQRPVLCHELSNCEPCYSWNVYHSWRLGDRARFLEGMYSLLAGGISPQTYINAESRHGVYGNIFVTPVLLDLVRLAVIDDAWREGELHVLRLVPRAWLVAGFRTRFERMVTEYGPVTLTFQLDDEGRCLDVTYRANFHHKPGKVVLYVPPVSGLNEVRLNGRSYDVQPGQVLAVE